MKNSLRKRFHLREKLFSLPVISDKWGNSFSLARKTVLLGAIKFFCKNWLLYNYDNGFHLQKKILLILNISSRQKRILQLLFLLLETIIKIRKDPIFKK